MKTLIAAAALIAAGAVHAAADSAGAAAPAADGQALSGVQFDAWVQGQREHIAAGKEAVTQRYQRDEFACWHRFAVNDCLDRARQVRRADLATLRQQELAVNASERDRRTQRRLRELEEKNAPASR